MHLLAALIARTATKRHERRTRTRRFEIDQTQFVTTGAAALGWSDFYYMSITVRWPAFIAGAVAVFLLMNGVFAVLYALGKDAIANLPPEHPFYLFYFSVETLSTVGYGYMYPQTHYGHIVASAEMFCGLAYAAAMTGLIFARFSRPKAQIIFAHQPVIGTVDGQQTFTVRLANARTSIVTDASARLWYGRSGVTAEGTTFYRYHELKLQRAENPTFALTWSVFHTIDETSLLYGATPESMAAEDGEFRISAEGLDENYGAPVHAQAHYDHDIVRWNHRYVDIISRKAEDVFHVDMARFHDIEPLLGTAQ
ncbi:ion channel [Methylovirgula sp. 4M-Z18]|uniref:ion channel n=1 Tax=Methylovirgula sp. 4M-Z18 TaxID=2293567 RepID=UPI000E2F967C|nr:ion channel [Methylovirgula sp. 4M-Z18]RFB75058.1 hypothetical protein DYH55_22865 [Methylovirgula sp. 4M-Z18]